MATPVLIAENRSGAGERGLGADARRLVEECFDVGRACSTVLVDGLRCPIVQHVFIKLLPVIESEAVGNQLAAFADGRRLVIGRSVLAGRQWLQISNGELTLLHRLGVVAATSSQRRRTCEGGHACPR